MSPSPRMTAIARRHRCGVLAEGDPAAADRASAKHTKDTGHPTAIVTVTEGCR